MLFHHERARATKLQRPSMLAVHRRCVFVYIYLSIYPATYLPTYLPTYPSKTTKRKVELVLYLKTLKSSLYILKTL